VLFGFQRSFKWHFNCGIGGWWKRSKCVWGSSSRLLPSEMLKITWAFAGVYGPNFDRDIRLLWKELACCSVGGTCLGALGMI
jgi:hypothetical protein